MAAWSPVLAQNVPLCASRDVILETLSKKYQEEPVAFGVTARGGLLEVLTARDGSTWSIILSTPQGLTCLTAAGEGWRRTEKTPWGPPA